MHIVTKIIALKMVSVRFLGKQIRGRELPLPLGRCGYEPLFDSQE